MKKITKKVPKLTGVMLTIDDVAMHLDGAENYFDDGVMFDISQNQKITVKVKGKIVDNKDVTISFEEVE